jgi:Tol biopolymer transport system component
LTGSSVAIRLLLGGMVALVAVFPATRGIGTAVAQSHRSDRPRLTATVAVVVDSRGKPAVAVLAANAKGWRVISRTPAVHGIRSMAWLPSGRKLAVTSAGGNLSNELRVIDRTRGTQRTLATAKRGEPAAFFGSVAWSPRGRWIAVTRSRSLYGADVNILDAGRGSLVRVFRVGARFDSALAWSDDGRSLYFAQQRTDATRPALRRLLVRTGKVFPIGQIRGFDPAPGPRGVLAYTVDDGIAVLEHGQERMVTGSRRGDRVPAWSHGGTRLFVERPEADCPRYGDPNLCSHVVVLMPGGGARRLLLRQLARNPATR